MVERRLDHHKPSSGDVLRDARPHKLAFRIAQRFVLRSLIVIPLITSSRPPTTHVACPGPGCVGGALLARLAARVADRCERHEVVEVGQVLRHFNVHAVDDVATLFNHGVHKVASYK